MPRSTDGVKVVSTEAFNWLHIALSGGMARATGKCAQRYGVSCHTGFTTGHGPVSWNLAVGIVDDLLANTKACFHGSFEAIRIVVTLQAELEGDHGTALACQS